MRPLSSMVPHGGRPPVVVVGGVGMGVGDGVGAIVIGVGEKAGAPTARAPSTMVRLGGIGLTGNVVRCRGGEQRGSEVQDLAQFSLAMSSLSFLVVYLAVSLFLLVLLVFLVPLLNHMQVSRRAELI